MRTSGRSRWRQMSLRNPDRRALVRFDKRRRRSAPEASGAHGMVLRGLQTQTARVGPLLAGEL